MATPVGKSKIAISIVLMTVHFYPTPWRAVEGDIHKGEVFLKPSCPIIQTTISYRQTTLPKTNVLVLLLLFQLFNNESFAAKLFLGGKKDGRNYLAVIVSYTECSLNVPFS